MSPWHPDDTYDAGALSREQGDEIVSADDVMDALRTDIAKAGSQVSWGRRHGVGPGYLGDVLSGRRPPGGKILEALGLHHAIVRTR